MQVSSRAFAFSPASMLSLKVAAFVVMVYGHADWFLADAQFFIHHTLGRVVFPVFGVILAFHLARMDRDRVAALVWRLVVACVVSVPLYAYLQGSTFPLNILATYLVAVVCWWLWCARMAPVALLVFLVASPLVDYSWFGVAGVLCCVWWFHTERRLSLVPLVVFAALLTPINGNLWALLSVPLIWLAATFLNGPAPRWKWLFYVGYPVHLGLLALVKATA